MKHALARLIENGQSTPEKTALWVRSMGPHGCSYARFLNKLAACQAYLQANGFQPGDKLLIGTPDSLDQIILQ